MKIFPAPQQVIAPAITLAPDALEQALAKSLQLAVNYHQCGQIENAETLYRGILDVQPQYPEANYQLGRLAVQVGQVEAGLSHFAAALEAQPEQAHYWLDYIDALLQADQMETAQQLLALGMQHGLQGEAVEALAGQLEASNNKKQAKIKAPPSRKPLKNSRPSSRDIKKMEILYKQERFAQVEALARLLTQRFPKHGFGWKMLGVVIQAQGRPDQALLPLQTASGLWSEDAETFCNLGLTLAALGRLSEAEASYRRALEIAPSYAEVHNNLGVIRKNQGRLAEAEVYYRRALKIKPTFIEAYSNLGNTLLDLGRLVEAEASYRRAVKIAPAFVEGYRHLGVVLDGQGRETEAEASYRRALQLRPNDAVSHSALLFGLSHHKAPSAASLFAEHCRFGAQFEAPRRALWRPHENLRDPARRLNIGFVSGDLYNHAVASFIEPVLAHLATYASLSLHAYSTHPSEDHVSQRLRGYIRHWHTVAGLSDTALVEKIRVDGIDILIDLSGHTNKHRLLTFAHKPAPVQVSWLGYPGTTGMSSIDYYLCDRFFLPPGQFDDQFTEKLVYLPGLAPFLPLGDAPPVNGLPALINGFVTFGSFNRLNKLSRDVVALWSQLLRALPTSRMVLGGLPEKGQYEILIGWFLDEGIALQRLSFHSRASMGDYLELHHQVDICLDTFPYNGSTTSLHAVCMGVPTLTMAGTTPAGRAGAWILGHVGLDEFIATDAAAFVRNGVFWADRLSTLASLRAGLRARFYQSALGQPALISAGLKRALRTMWQLWCAGLPAASFEVSITGIGQDKQEVDV